MNSVPDLCSLVPLCLLIYLIKSCSNLSSIVSWKTVIKANHKVIEMQILGTEEEQIGILFHGKRVKKAKILTITFAPQNTLFCCKAKHLLGIVVTPYVQIVFFNAS